jgi:hypothetical protein
METKDNPVTLSRKLLSHHWELNSWDYHDQVSFMWKHNEIRISIRAFCTPPGKDRSVQFNFYLNGEHTLFVFNYNCYGGSSKGTTPQLVSENFRLTFQASPNCLEIYQQQVKQEGS